MQLLHLNPSSEGLRRFHARCMEPAPPEALGGPWGDLRDWVEEHVPQEEIVALYLALAHDLDPVRDAVDGTPEEQRAQDLYLAMDVVWYAMTDESIEQVESARRRERAGGQPLTTGGGGSSTR